MFALRQVKDKKIHIKSQPPEEFFSGGLFLNFKNLFK